MSTMTLTSSLPQVLSYGGGLDSWIMLFEGVRRGDVPEVVAFCDVTDPERKDPGEWPGTYDHIEQVVIPFCAKHGIRFEWIDTDRYPVRDAPSLFSWMEKRNQVPVAGNTRICTKIAKVERFEAWLDDVYPGQQVAVWIGFEAGEENRAAKDPNAGKPSARRINRFPLIEWGLCRCACEQIARDSGLPVPRKSACVFCPYASRCDWQTFASEIPGEFAKIVKLEADKPLTKNGEKIAIMGFGKKRKDGTRNLQLLDEWVTKPGRPRPPKVCAVCGEVRATKATASSWLAQGDQDTLSALQAETSEDVQHKASSRLTQSVSSAKTGPAVKRTQMTRFNADRIVSFNCGVGRDSLAMLGLLVEGELVVDGRKIGPEDIDAAIFSDPGAEWDHTMKLLPAIRELCYEHGIRFIMLRKPRKDGAQGWAKFLADKQAGVSFGRGKRPWMHGRWTTIEEKANEGGYHLEPPIVDDYRSRSTVASLGKGDCTDKHKIQPIRKVLADLCNERFGVPTNDAWGRLVRAGERKPHVSLIGIAADESDRVKESGRKVSYTSERYPLIEMDIAKTDEQPILERHGFGHARKSGCWACPFQPPSWFWVIRETQPARWAQLLEYEEAALARNPKMFVTGRKPLTTVVERWRTKNPDATIDAVLDKSYKRGCARIAEIRSELKAQAREDAEAQRDSKRAERAAKRTAPAAVVAAPERPSVRARTSQSDLPLNGLEDYAQATQRLGFAHLGTLSFELESVLQRIASCDFIPMLQVGLLTEGTYERRTEVLTAISDRIVTLENTVFIAEAERQDEAHANGMCPHCGTDWLMDGMTIYGCDIHIGDGDCYMSWRGCCEQTHFQVMQHGFEDTYDKTVVEVARLIAPEYDVIATSDDCDAEVICRLRLHNPTEATGKTDRHGHQTAKSPKGWQTAVFDRIDTHHRHHDAPQGWKFGISVHNGPIEVGVAIIGKPKSRMLQAAEPGTLEVTRVATWGHSALRKNASTKLYAAACKQARALGFDKVITYTLAIGESGGSLIAAGWAPTLINAGGSWDRPSRERQDKAPTTPKVRWEKGLSKTTKRDIESRRIDLDDLRTKQAVLAGATTNDQTMALAEAA